MSNVLKAKEFAKILETMVLKEYEETRLDKSLMDVTCILSLEKSVHVPDTLTRIRVLPTVSVVGQRSPVERKDSGATVEVYVKFLPNSSDTYKNILNIAKLIKTLPGVKVVRVVSLSDKAITYKGKPIVV